MELIMDNPLPNNDKKKHNGKAYSKEFKIAATKLVTEQGYGAKEAAASLGLAQSTLQYWVKIYGTKPQPQAQTLDSLRLQVRELQTQNQRLLAER
jgi:transposase